MKRIIRDIVILLVMGIFFYIAYQEEINRFYKTQFRKNDIKLENKDKFKIYFIDVGEGDSILINNNSKYSLIDAGNNEDGKKLVKYFKELGIDEFEYLITTHIHEDHMGGMDDIIKNFKIKHFLIPDTSSNYLTYTEVIKLLDEKNIIKEVPNIDSTFTMEDSIFNVLWIDNNLENINDSSIVLKLYYKNTSYLFTADISKEVELKILNKNLKSNVLKVAHHGGGYSTSAQFLEKVKPDYAIISVGKDNDYGHPKKVVLDKLDRLNIKTYRTDQVGTIILSSDGENIFIETSNTDTNGN